MARQPGIELGRRWPGTQVMAAGLHFHHVHEIGTNEFHRAPRFRFQKDSWRIRKFPKVFSGWKCSCEDVRSSSVFLLAARLVNHVLVRGRSSQLQIHVSWHTKTFSIVFSTFPTLRSFMGWRHVVPKWSHITVGFVRWYPQEGLSSIVGIRQKLPKKNVALRTKHIMSFYQFPSVTCPSHNPCLPFFFSAVFSVEHFIKRSSCHGPNLESKAGASSRHSMHLAAACGSCLVSAASKGFWKLFSCRLLDFLDWKEADWICLWQLVRVIVVKSWKLLANVRMCRRPRQAAPPRSRIKRWQVLQAMRIYRKTLQTRHLPCFFRVEWLGRYRNQTTGLRWSKLIWDDSSPWLALLLVSPAPELSGPIFATCFWKQSDLGPRQHRFHGCDISQVDSNPGAHGHVFPRGPRGSRLFLLQRLQGEEDKDASRPNLTFGPSFLLSFSSLAHALWIRCVFALDVQSCTRGTVVTPTKSQFWHMTWHHFTANVCSRCCCRSRSYLLQSVAWDVTTSASSSGQTTHLCMGRQEMRDGMRWGCRSRLIFAGQMLQGEVASGHSSRITRPLKCILGRGEVRVKMCIFESRNSIPQDPPDTHCLAGTLQKKDGRGVTLCCRFFFGGWCLYIFRACFFPGILGNPGATWCVSKCICQHGLEEAPHMHWK